MNNQHIERALHLPGCERLRDFVEVGPVQRAALERFVDELSEQEPVATPNQCTRTAPKRIWIQISDDSQDCNEPFPFPETDAMTWCSDSVMACEVEYVRADLSAAFPAQPGTVAVPRELLERAVAALTRHLDRHAPMRIPVDQTDSDVVREHIRQALSAAPAVEGARGS